METLFVLQVYTYQTWRRRYPRYRISADPTYYCHTLTEAEELLSQLVLNKDGKGELWLPDNVHHFTINEYPYGCIAYYISSRLYDPDGNLIDRSLCSGDAQNGDFHGRPEEMMRFGHGDIVEVMGLDEVVLGFVVSCPVDIKRAELLNSDRPTLDDTDDTYTIMTTSEYMESHEHVHALALFRPMFPIPKPTLNRLQKAYDKFIKDDMQDFINECANHWLILLPEPIGMEIYTGRWTRKERPFKCSFVFPHTLIHILDRSITLCRDNRSFIDADGVRKMAFTVEDLTQVPEEYRKECMRI